MNRRIRSYIDANVIINAFRGQTEELVQIAISLLEDKNRTILFSDFLRLEVLAKPTAFKNTIEIEFIQTVLEKAAYVPFSVAIPPKAWQVASRYGLGALDALHIASALIAKADEFVSFEKTSKPFYNVSEKGFTITSLLP